MSKWDKTGEGNSSNRSAPIEPKTIFISQPASSSITFSNNEPLTDEYLNAVLPSAGYKIIPPPEKYSLKRYESQPQNPTDETNYLPIPKEFETLYTDLRPDEELSQEEKNERLVMNLLISIKEGTVFQRKNSMRILVNLAPRLGADLIFGKIIPLINSKNLTELERHSLVKTIDRLMYRLSGSISPYIPDLLSFVGSMLIDNEAVTRAEGREIVSNLTKIAGFNIVLKSVRESLNSDNETTRRIVSQTLATAATAVGIEQIFPLIKACLRSRKSVNIRLTGVETINSIAFQNHNGVLPHLSDLVEMLTTACVDSEPSVKYTAVRATRTLAEAAAPYGGKVFQPLTDFIFGLYNESNHRDYLNTIGSLMMTMDAADCAFNFAKILRNVERSFQSTDDSMRSAALHVFDVALDKDAVSAEQLERLVPNFFASFWTQQTALIRRMWIPVKKATVAIAARTSLQQTIEMFFLEMQSSSLDYGQMAVEALDMIMKRCDFRILPPEVLDHIGENLTHLYEISDERRSKLMHKVLKKYVDIAGTSLQSPVDYVLSHTQSYLNMPQRDVRLRAAELFAIFVPIIHEKGLNGPLIAFYENLQNCFSEEDPHALAAVLRAMRALAEVVDLPAMETKPDAVVARLVPVLKNRNEDVAYACVRLLQTLSKRAGTIANSKEWMRICFELLEMLKAEKRKVRDVAISAFSDIARAISPFDVLLALLDNLKVQERNLRQCTTVAIALLAKSAGTYKILPPLMNEYRTPDANVQTSTLKALAHLFQAIGGECADYCYAVTPLLTHALIERDAVHRQNACAAARAFIIGLYGAGKEDAVIHLMNHIMPNVFESTLHFIEIFMDTVDALRLTLGPGVVLQYTLAGLFHPARKVRSQFWRIFNNLIIYAGDQLVPYYPMMADTEENSYHRDELDVFV